MLISLAVGVRETSLSKETISVMRLFLRSRSARRKENCWCNSRKGQCRILEPSAIRSGRIDGLATMTQSLAFACRAVEKDARLGDCEPRRGLAGGRERFAR